MLEHGGRLHEAAQHYGIPLSDWLDLSTGISPFAYPLPSIPSAAWQRLPEMDDGLRDAASAYYGTPHLLAVAGVQAAIQALPQLRSRSRVGIIAPGYAEHAQCWTRAGHRVVCRSAADLFRDPGDYDVVILIHPNNPTGERFPADRLLELQAGLAARGGWLVLDEAFIDPTPDASLARSSSRAGLIVLRSLGKFFGLAGARVGFVLAADTLLKQLHEALGPWTLAGPARFIAKVALADGDWQASQRDRVRRAATQLAGLLRSLGLPPTGGCALFQWCRCARAADVHLELAERGIWVRKFSDPASVRFGLPGDAAGFRRLRRALAEMLG